MDTQTEDMPTDDQVEQAVDTLKLVADPTRMRILWALLHGEHSVNPWPNTSERSPPPSPSTWPSSDWPNLVRTRREGSHVYYLAQNDHVQRIVEEALFHADHVVQGLPDHDEQPAPRRVESKEMSA